jgi:hypothetical protein
VLRQGRTNWLLTIKTCINASIIMMTIISAAVKSDEL